MDQHAYEASGLGKSQCAQILSHMKARGPITPLDALALYGCFRLAARIKDLRDQGHDIVTHEVTLENGKTVARYHLRAAEVELV